MSWRVLAAWLECFPESIWCQNEQVCQGRKIVKRFERSNGLDTALYKNIPFYNDAIGVFRNAFLGNCRFDDFRCRATGTLITTDREQGIPRPTNTQCTNSFISKSPPSVCERRSCYSHPSAWLNTGSIQRDKLARKRQWRRYANG